MKSGLQAFRCQPVISVEAPKKFEEIGNLPRNEMRGEITEY